jgi:hypothetical protein
MVRFSYSARVAFFATILLQVPTTSDAFAPCRRIRHFVHTASSLYRPTQLQASPHPPDTPPPPAYFAKPEEEDSDEDDNKMEVSESSPSTSMSTTSTADPPTPLYTEEDFEEFKKFSNELGHKAVEYLIVSPTL